MVSGFSTIIPEGTNFILSREAERLCGKPGHIVNVLNIYKFKWG